MKGFGFLFLSLIICPSVIYAANTSDKTKMFNTKLGCMACHMANSMEPEKISKKNHLTSHNHKHKKTTLDRA